MDLSLELLKEKNLGLGSILSLKPMGGGYSNDNYLLTTSSGKYRLRIPKYTRTLATVLTEQKLLKSVIDRFPLPVPLIRVFTLSEGVPISIFPYIQADSIFDIQNESLLFHAGKVLSEYHQFVQGYSGGKELRKLSDTLYFAKSDLDTLHELVKDFLNSGYPDLWDAVNKLYNQIRDFSAKFKEEPYISLPFVTCHGDYAPANILSQKNRVVGIIDFEIILWAPKAYDVAIGLLALQQTEGYEEKMSTWFTDGYQSNIPLSYKELEYIPALQRIRTLESANRHFCRVIKKEEAVNADLIMYWSRII